MTNITIYFNQIIHLLKIYIYIIRKCRVSTLKNASENYTIIYDQWKHTPRPRSPWSCQRVARNRAPACPLSALPSAAETSLRSPVCQIPQFVRSATVGSRLLTTFRALISHHRNTIRFHSTCQFFPLSLSLPLQHFAHFFSFKSLVCPTSSQSFLAFSSTVFYYYTWNGN